MGSNFDKTGLMYGGLELPHHANALRLQGAICLYLGCAMAGYTIDGLKGLAVGLGIAIALFGVLSLAQLAYEQAHEYF
jgi:hypothetical protein